MPKQQQQGRYLERPKVQDVGRTGLLSLTKMFTSSLSLSINIISHQVGRSVVLIGRHSPHLIAGLPILKDVIIVFWLKERARTGSIITTELK